MLKYSSITFTSYVFKKSYNHCVRQKYVCLFKKCFTFSYSLASVAYLQFTTSLKYCSNTPFFLIIQLRKENSSTPHVSSENTNYIYKKIFYINYSGIFCLNNLSWNHYLKSLARSKNIHARSIIFSIFIFFDGKYFSIVQYYTFSCSKYKFYRNALDQNSNDSGMHGAIEWYI